MSDRVFLSGGDLVLPDRVLAGGTLVIERDRIVDVVDRPARGGEADATVDVSGRIVSPGFVDTHVHGIAGHDVLDGPGAVAAVARELPRYGVTSFCPTSVACEARALAAFLDECAACRAAGPHPSAARVLPAHLESNFINGEYCGAQPRELLRAPGPTAPLADDALLGFDDDVIRVIGRFHADVGIVTLAPELDGGLDLVRAVVRAGITVSVGHSGATFEQARAAFDAGAARATHLFNRMTPLASRAPGVAGAALADDRVTAEIIADGHHVHPAVMRVAIAAKGLQRVVAITDGTAGSGLPPGAVAGLGGRRIHVREVARLDDGTMAGSVATMDRVLACLVHAVGLSLPDAVALCSTTPAHERGLKDLGVLGAGSAADLTVLTRTFAVEQTWIAGRRVH